MQVSSPDLEHATDSRHAADLVQAHLIQTLSSLGRPTIDFYFLRSRIAFPEAQISGALEALESARQEGHVRYFGLYSESDAQATMTNWMMHDAFEALSVDGGSAEASTLISIAKERRVGILFRSEGAHGDRAVSKGEAVLIPVRSAGEILAAIRQQVGEAV
jgi:aryl-alcohol dehydrogenase-like predicted oxidoreductase